MMKQGRNSSKTVKPHTVDAGHPMAAESFFAAWRGYMIAVFRLAATSRRDVG
jgi:hypothetical protein